MKTSFDSEKLRNLHVPAFLHNPLIYIGVGLVLVLIMAFVLFSGSSGERDGEKAYEQGVRAKNQVLESVAAFQRLLQDPEVTSLAKLALQEPDAIDDLSQYLTGRSNEFRSVRLFGKADYLAPVDELGENGWIMMDMILSAKGGAVSPLQVFTSGEESVVAGMVAIDDQENRLGYMMIAEASDALLSGFNMTMPLGGYIALQQSNGRFKPTVISAYGNESAIKAGAHRITVPGTMFAVVVPKPGVESSMGGFQSLVIFLIGAALLVFGVMLRQRQLHPVKELTQDPARLKLVEVDTDIESIKTDEPEADMNDPEEGQTEPPEPELPAHSLTDLPFDVGDRPRIVRSAALPVELLPEIFRAYDIRGIIGKTLDAGVARQVGQAIGTLALEEDATPVMVGRDGRHSGPELVEGMIEGISSTGCDVVDIGAVPTGVLYYAAYEAGSGSGVMVTGSHNPPDYNGFKVMMGGKTLSGERITALYDCIEAGELRVGKGEVTQEEMLEKYRDRIAGDIQLARPLKVVADCGNGIGGICAADILRSIGAEVIPLFDEVDGDFPNHHPDPSDPKNLEDLIGTVQMMDADIGVAFDGDADRLGVVTPSGEIMFSDRTMMLFIKEILSRNPGAKIIYDVKCTGKLDAIIREAGGEPEMYKTGHSLIKNRMKEVDAPFAAEMSGHFFFTDRWYGFDCGIYSAARLLEILANDERTPQEVLLALPNDVSTPELKIEMQEGENHAFVEKFQKEARFADARVSTIDGLRADYEYGWGLVRASNTTPILVVRFEAEDEESLKTIKEAFRMQMLALNPDLDLPF